MVALRDQLLMARGLTRRQVLAAGGSAALLAAGGVMASRLRESRPLPGAVLGAPAALGHRLRTGDFPAPSETRSVDVVIAGAGIAGLSAARDLVRAGHDDLLILEAAAWPGGNAASGRNGVSAYPWGAHYVPLVRNDDQAMLDLFAGHGLIRGYEADLPVYDEYVLSSDPQERLKVLGRWQEGLVPQLGASAADLAEFARFFTLVESLRVQRGADGRPLFAIPADHSSRDPAWLRLDTLTFTQWLREQGFRSQRLAWYLDYCCRDDYGGTAQDVSAWAGLHYFAARAGKAANADPSSVVTWPEGNGWFVGRWAAELGRRIETQALASRVTPGHDGVVVDYFDARRERTVRVQARAAVLALPRFVTRRIFPGLDAGGQGTDLQYSPWAVANVTVARLPRGNGMDLAWDNVVYGSPTLGYVVATHQAGALRGGSTVLTCYWPLSHRPPAEARAEALARSHYDWQQLFEADLLRGNPELEGQLLSMDVMVWGHGIVRPTPGTLWGPDRAALSRQQPPVFLAHSDMSGISIFEEAFHRGRHAALECSAWLRKSAAARTVLGAA